MSPRKHRPRVLISSSQRSVRVPRKKLIELVEFVGDSEGVAIAEVDIAVVTSQEIGALNRRYLTHSGPTDVLSFDLSDSTVRGICVQLVVCGDVAAVQARKRGIGVQQELMLYVVHGLLHVMGYDDQSIRGATRMRAREEELLAEFLRRRR